MLGRETEYRSVGRRQTGHINVNLVCKDMLKVDRWPRAR